MHRENNLKFGKTLTPVAGSRKERKGMRGVQWTRHTPRTEPRIVWALGAKGPGSFVGTPWTGPGMLEGSGPEGPRTISSTRRLGPELNEGSGPEMLSNYVAPGIWQRFVWRLWVRKAWTNVYPHFGLPQGFSGGSGSEGPRRFCSDTLDWAKNRLEAPGPKGPHIL